MMNRIFSLLLFLLSSPLLYSQSPDNLIPRELLFKEKDKVKISLSKDGETVFYQKKADGSDSTLYFINRKIPTAERHRKFEGVLVNWMLTIPDGLAAVVQQDSSRYVYFTTLNANTARKLDILPFQNLEFLSLSARFPNKVLVDIEAKDATQSGIYVLDLLSGSLKRLTVKGNLVQVFCDQNFGLVAALEQNDLGGHSIMRRSGGNWTEVFKHEFRPDLFIGGLNKILSVSPDGKTIYATDNTGKDKTTLVAIDAETGEVTELASDPDADILPFAATFDENGKPVSVVALWGDTKRHVIDASYQKDFDFLAKEMTGNVSVAETSTDGETWLVRSLDGGPVKYYLYDRSSQNLLYLFNDYSYLNDYKLATRKTFTVTTGDGMRLPVQVYLPPGMFRSDGIPKSPLATVIYVHGGPWAGVTHWNSWFHNRNFQLLANRGYVVINMEFRGTTGLGKKVTDAGDLQWGEAMHNDIVDVANWAINSGIAHPRRLGIWGWSYGGYAANYALGKAPDLFACGVSMYGISDLNLFCQTPFADNDFWHSRVGNPDTLEGSQLLKKFSPSSYVSQIKSPLLLTTGSLDERVPQSQSDDFAKALSEAGKEVVYFYYPEEMHDYRKAESWISFWAIAEHFLHEKLGGRKQAGEGDIEKGNFKVVYGEKYIGQIK